MTHEHCDQCFSTNCFHAYACSMVYCPNGCAAHMHQCKLDDHQYICANAYSPCFNVLYGCPFIGKRSQLGQHLLVCPASVSVCRFVYMNHERPKKHDNEETNVEPLPSVFTDNSMAAIAQTMTLRDSIWWQHKTEFDARMKEITATSEFDNNLSKTSNIDRSIRSEKYSYITMPECVLSKRDGIICSTCRRHIRQLEENEDERLANLTEGERQMMANFSLLSTNDLSSSYQSTTTTPSLVKMSSTVINSSDIPISQPAVLSSKNIPIESLSNISDIELSSSHIYRLNYFSTLISQHEYLHNVPLSSLAIQQSQSDVPLDCHALCRRDEIEQHWHIHLTIDCTIDTWLIQRCPKYQYGCSFHYERFEPCQCNGQPIRMRFDEANDAIAFEWMPSSHDNNQQFNLLDLPFEILSNILIKLDSLSLRNISLVCRRLRDVCRQLLPVRGLVIIEYERKRLSHGHISWTERRKHWLFSNTSSAVPKWQFKPVNVSSSLNQHLITCPFGIKKDLTKEPPFPLLQWTDPKTVLKSPSAD